jgi:hypothetical protein
MARVTLDADGLYEALAEARKRGALERLVAAAGQGRVDIQLSQPLGSHGSHDILSRTLRNLPILDMSDFQHLLTSASRLVQGEDALLDYYSQAVELAQGRNSEAVLSTADWLRLHVHSLQGRDYFLTWAKPLLLVAPEVGAEFKVRIVTPETFLKFGEY